MIFAPPPTIRYFNMFCTSGNPKHPHVVDTIFMPLAPLVKVDILTNLPVQDGSVILFKYISEGQYSATEYASGTSNEKEQSW